MTRTLEAHRGDIPLDRLRCRRRPRNRDRLEQFYCAEQPGKPSGALDAGYLLRRRQGCEGKPLLLRTHTSPMQVRYARMWVDDFAYGESPADQGDRAGPHLSRRQRRHPFADVPSGRRPVDRRRLSFADLKGVYTDFVRLLRDRRSASAFPALLFSVHRAVGRNRHRLRQRALKGPLAGSVRRRPGASERGAQFRARPGKLHRLRLRLRPRSA